MHAARERGDVQETEAEEGRVGGSNGRGQITGASPQERSQGPATSGRNTSIRESLRKG